MYKFSADSRLKQAKQFKDLLNNCRKIKSYGFSVFVQQKADLLQNPRLGIIIAKRNVALAVQRNRIKRIIRESFRLHQSLIKNHDVVVIVYKNIMELNNQELTVCLNKIWQSL